MYIKSHEGLEALLHLVFTPTGLCGLPGKQGQRSIEEHTGL